MKANDENIQLQHLINELKKERDLEKAEEQKRQAEERRQEEAREIKVLREKINREIVKEGKIEKGSHVRMLDGELSGEVLKISGKRATVLFGQLKMQVPLSEIVPTKEQLDIQRGQKISVDTRENYNDFSPKLDIRGYKVEDAEITLQEYFDRAILANAHLIEIVHGKGSGVLRRLVRDKTREYKDISKVWHPPDEHGGEGVTFVKWS